MTEKRKIRNNKIRADIKKHKEFGMKIKDAIVIVADIYFLSSHRIREIWYYRDEVVKSKKAVNSILCIGLLFLMSGRVV